MKAYHDNEFGRPPEEFPIFKEDDRPPVAEDFGMPEAAAGAPEYAVPAPEYPEPGSSSAAQEETGKRRRSFRRKLMMLAAAAAAFFLFFMPRGTAGFPVIPVQPTQQTGSDEPDKPGTETDAEPGTEPAESTAEPGESTAEPAEPETYADIPGDPEEPQISINYAVRDGNTVRYNYITGVWVRGEICPLTVWQLVYSPSTGYRAVPEHDPDVWEGSRDLTEYTVPVDTDAQDLQLVLTGTFTLDGEEKMIRAVRDIIPMPPEPGLSSTVSVGPDGISYEGVFIPQAGDDRVYDLSVVGFGCLMYSETGELIGGYSVYDDAVPEIHPRTGGGFEFFYSGPMNRYFPDTAVSFSIGLTVVDQNTGLRYDLETERHDVVRKVFEEPGCEITAFNFWSEMHAGILFSNMADVTKVTLEVWDPVMDYMDSSTDITEEAVRDLRYDVKPFTTDGIYEANQDYYGQPGVDFPMTVEFRVIIEYSTESGTRSATWSATTSAETGFYVKYLADADAALDPDHAGKLVIVTDSTPEVPESTVFLDQPDQVTGPGIISISAEINGEKVPAEDFQIDYYDYDAMFGGSDVTVHIRQAEVLLERPESMPEGEDSVVTMYVTHYLTSIGGAYTSRLEVPFAPMY